MAPITNGDPRLDSVVADAQENNINDVVLNKQLYILPTIRSGARDLRALHSFPIFISP